jgi:scyllo-inositol 2-dehydrogenase (NADP+)
MKAIIVGLGTQGYKRKKILFNRKKYVCSFDPINKEAEVNKIERLNKYNYDTVFICCPDKFKKKYILYFLNKKKNILVEKPLRLEDSFLRKVEKISNINKKFFYVAYNHRFEPHFERIKELVDKKTIGEMYLIKFFYGNGTAKLVNSSWRKKELGILDDIGSHLIDICFFWLEKKINKIKNVYFNNLENYKSDYANISFHVSNIVINFEFTYCSWKNTFNCKVLGKKGSLIMNGLCKWGPSILDNQKRVFPSGKPISSRKTLKIKDPTWEKEIIFFEKNINEKTKVNLNKEIYLNKLIDKINNYEKF